MEIERGKELPRMYQDSGPNEFTGENASGLECFLDPVRPCTAQCMAYQTFPPQGDEFTGQQFARCMLLTNVHRVGKHAVIIAKALVKLSTPSMAPPNPRGGP